MIKLTKTLALAALPLSLALTAMPASAQAIGGFAPRAPQAAPQMIGSQWMIAPNGCSYSRTQAPGQPVQWMLIHNPHHIGGSRSRPDCPSM